MDRTGAEKRWRVGSETDLQEAAAAGVRLAAAGRASVSLRAAGTGREALRLRRGRQNTMAVSAVRGGGGAILGCKRMRYGPIVIHQKQVGLGWVCGLACNPRVRATAHVNTVLQLFFFSLDNFVVRLTTRFI